MKKLLVCGAVVLFVLCGVFVASCSSGSSSSSNTPKQVVTTMLNDTKSGNYTDAYKYLSAQDKKTYSLDSWLQYNKGAASSAGSYKDVSFKVTGEKITGDTAAVNVKLTQGKQSQTGNYILVKEGGQWKMSLEKTANQNQ